MSVVGIGVSWVGCVDCINVDNLGSCCFLPTFGKFVFGDVPRSLFPRFNANQLTTGQMGHKMNEKDMFVQTCDLVDNIVVGQQVS